MKYGFEIMNLGILVLITAALFLGIWQLPSEYKVLNTVVLLAAALVLTIPNIKRKDPKKTEKEYLEKIVDTLAEGVIVYDENFKVLVWNSASEKIFKLSKKEILGQSFTLKIKKDASLRYSRLLTILFPALATSIIRRSDPGVFPQVVDISFDNPPLDLRVVTHRITNEIGKTKGFAKVIIDRTREITLLQSKSDFITVASHQLQTPISGLSWAISNIQEEPLSENQKSLVANMAGAVNRLVKIVTDLLDVANIEKARFGYHFESQNLISFIEEALVSAKPVAEQYNVKLYFEKPNDIEIKAMIDPPKLGIVLRNLLDNAIKYNIPNGEVVVSIAPMKDKPYVEISVRDTGIGIPEEQMDKVFTRFFRGENAMKSVVEGTGLGLYIAKHIIRAHGGEIGVASTINRGSTFSFTLPLDPKLVPQKEIFYDEE